MTDYLKVVRRKPVKESEAQKRASEAQKSVRERIDAYYANHPDNPFIPIADMLMAAYRENKRLKREREGGFVLDNNHRHREG